MRSTVGNSFVPLCLLVVIAGCGHGTQETLGSITLRVFRGVSTDEIRVTGSEARYLNGQHAKIAPSRAKQIQEIIELLVRDVPEGIYRTPWHRARSLEVVVDGRRAVYFLGCSDAVWSPPEPLLKAVALIEDLFPVNEAAHRHALKEIGTRLAREIPQAKFESETLEHILRFAREYADVPVSLSWSELAAYGVTPELRLRVVGGNMTVEQFLGHILSSVNAVASTKIVASVHSGGVLIGPRRHTGGPPNSKGEPPVSGSRELCVFHVINSGVGDFAMSVDNDGFYRYGFLRTRKPKEPRFSGRELDGYRNKARRVLATVPSGHYRSPYDHEIILEIPVEGGSRLYVLTTLATDPKMPETLVDLWGAMNGLCAW